MYLSKKNYVIAVFEAKKLRGKFVTFAILQQECVNSLKWIKPMQNYWFSHLNVYFNICTGSYTVSTEIHTTFSE